MFRVGFGKAPAAPIEAYASEPLLTQHLVDLILINARDGHGGDVVTCRNPAVRVMADAGDVVTGPCLQVDTINGKGTVAS